MRKPILLSLLVTISCLLTACGYTFEGAGSVLPPDVKRIYIPLVENNSTEPGLTTLFTEALRDHFEQYGVVNVVDEPNDADAVLRTRILKVTREAGAVRGTTDSAIQLDTKLELAAELRRSNGQLLWKNSSFNVSKTFGSISQLIVTSSSALATSGLGAGDLATLGNTGSREVQRSQERDVLAALADTAASQIYDAAVAPDF